MWTVVVLVVVVYLLWDRLIRLLKVNNFKDKFVLVTGCDSGFGRELAIRLDGMGFPVFATCLTEVGRRGLEKTCSSRLVTLSLNVTDNDSISAAFLTVKQRLPHESSLWAVVNNAGVAGRFAVAEMCGHDDYVLVSNVNLFGPIEVSQVFMPLQRKSRGRLVIMTSVVGRIHVGSGPYSASKAGLEAFGDVIRRDIARFGIKVSLIEPGIFQTDLSNKNGLINSNTPGFNMANQKVQESYGKGYITWSSDKINKITGVSSPYIFKVVDAYMAAITSVYPRPRYVVGTDARFFWIPLSFLPDWLADWTLALLMGQPGN